MQFTSLTFLQLQCPSAFQTPTSASTKSQRYCRSLVFPPSPDHSVQKLANSKEGPKGKRYNELLELCTRWNAVPALYELEGVVRQGDQAKRVSQMTEIWKGTYDGEVVALKVLRLSRDDPDIQVAQKVKALCNIQWEARILLR